MHIMEKKRVKRRQSRWNRLAWLAGAAIVAAGLWKAGEAALPRYHRWKQNRALDQAKQFIAKHDAPNAQLALDVAMREIPGNPDTIRVAADMLEQVSAPQAMRLRRAVVQIVPDSAEDAAKLVLCCLRFRDFNAAKDALSSMSPIVAAKPAALRAALAYAVSTDDRAVADYLFQRLKAEGAQDTDIQHAHALLLLKHPNDGKRDQARKDLEKLAQQQPPLALQIHRELAGAALQRKDYADAQTQFTAVLADPGATLSDRLQRANVELLINHRPFADIFAEVAPTATKSEADALDFVQWLLVQNRAAEADQWLASLPAAVRTSRGAKAAEAEVVSQLKDWDRLSTLLQDGAWGSIAKDTLRLAMAAHTVDNPARPSLRHDTWEMALNSAGSSLTSFRTLQRLAAMWQWNEESEQTLWAIARHFPDQTWAHQALFNVHREKKNIAGMRDIMNALRNADGAVARYQHDWALLTLLVEPTSNWNPAKETMKKLYEGTPSNPTYATGYAFALAQAGKAADANAVIDKMSESERNYPPRQPYLAFVYGAGKKAAEFARAQSLAEGVNFLAEESYLFTRAREALEKKPERPVTTKPAAPAKT